MEGRFWKRCNTCKNEIGYGTGYYVCSVSTCHRKGTDFAFCTVECWEAHVPLFRHRDSWAEERRSPARPAAGAAGPAAATPPPRSEPPRRPEPPPRSEPPERRPPPAAPPGARSDSDEERPPLELNDRKDIPEDILVVASKLKAYIRARSGMNTSDGVLPAFSHILRDLCDEAIERAYADGRKTVMDRDLP